MMDLIPYYNIAIGPFELFFLIIFIRMEARGSGYYTAYTARRGMKNVRARGVANVSLCRVRLSLAGLRYQLEFTEAQY
jgi:hypothetical protein